MLKQRPRTIKGRNYVKFNNEKFKAELVKQLSFKNLNQFKPILGIHKYYAKSPKRTCS